MNSVRLGQGYMQSSFPKIYETKYAGPDISAKIASQLPLFIKCYFCPTSNVDREV